MKQDRETTVGIFVLGGIVLALAAIVAFGDISPFSKSTRAVIVFKDSIAGLSVGAPVTFRGVRVGAVENIVIELDANGDAAFIPVTVRLEPGKALVAQKDDGHEIDLSSLVERGLRAELDTQSFVTGQSQIDLDFDPASPPVLHPDITKLPEIPTRQSPIQKAKEQLSQLPLRELADNASAMLLSMRQLAEKLAAELPPMVSSVKATSDASAKTVADADAAITAMQARVDTTLADISRLANAASGELDRSGKDVHTLLAASTQTMQQMHDLLGELRASTSSRSADRQNVDSALRDISAAAASLRGFASDVEHNPQLLLTGRRP